MKIRYPAVEGSFYPSDEKELHKMMSDFDKKAIVEPLGRPAAVIVPHAGLFYSGLTAAYAYKSAAGYSYRSAVIFTPSHRVAFYGMSGGNFDCYEFMGKNININRELTETLQSGNSLVSFDKAHLFEHSAEVQLPFIKRYLDFESLSVFVYGEIEYRKLSYAISDVIKEGRDLVIISSDLSHYHPYEECKKTDRYVIDGINELNIDKISRGEACGMTGIKAMVDCAAINKLKPVFLDYRNSGDITGDRSGVVGYMSVAFI